MQIINMTKKGFEDIKNCYQLHGKINFPKIVKDFKFVSIKYEIITNPSAKIKVMTNNEEDETE